jgi:hypothetical protein
MFMYKQSDIEQTTDYFQISPYLGPPNIYVKKRKSMKELIKLSLSNWKTWTSVQLFIFSITLKKNFY